MSEQIGVACCLVLIIEGLILAAMPAAWQRMMLQLATVDPARLRNGGIAAMLVGLVCLKIVNG